MPRDVNQLAAQIVKLATSEAEPEAAEPAKNPAAVALGKLGGAARRTKLPQAQRSEIARKAVNARWRKHRKSK